jgi:hypothetical protein
MTHRRKSASRAAATGEDCSNQGTTLSRGSSPGQEELMTGTESVIILLCLVLGVVLIAMAWWVSGINTALARLSVELEVRHLERNAERAAEKRMREARQKQLFLWLAQTASTLKGLHGIAEKLGDRKDTGVMTSPPQTSDAPLSAPPPTVRELRASDAATPRSASTEDHLRESDADTLAWTGPSSSRTLLGVGVTELSEPSHGPPRARELTRQLEKSRQ